MVSDNTNNAYAHTDDTTHQQRDGSQNPTLNMVNQVRPGDFASLSSGPNTASQYLPHDLQIVDATNTTTTTPGERSNQGEQPSSGEQPKPGEQPKLGEQPQPAGQLPGGEEKRGATTVKNDDQGKPKEYGNGDYSLSKHDDGKWYYHQNGDGHDFVEVNGDSIKMDDQGKVTYSESGMFGKDNQTLGNGSTGFLSSLTSAASHVEDAVVNHPLDTFNKVAFMPLAAVDAIAGTHTIKAIGEIEKGAVNEVIHHPGEILKDVAIGVAIGALTVATGGGALVAIGIGVGALAATELVKNGGDLGGVANDVSAFGSTIAGWGQDIATVAGPGQRSQEEEAAAEQGLQQLGAFGAQTVAGIAGGAAGGAGVAAAGLEGSIPRAASTIASKIRPTTEPVAEPLAAPEMPSPAQFHRVVSDGKLDFADPYGVLKPGDTFLPQQQLGLTYSEAGDAMQFASPFAVTSAEDIARGLSGVPQEIRELVLNSGLNNGTKLTLCNKVTDAYPHLAGVTPRGYSNGSTFENNAAFYEPSANEIVVAETLRDARGFQIPANNLDQTLRHEFGHAFDTVEGNISDRGSFSYKWKQDVDNIEAHAPQVVKDQLEYFIKNINEQSARSESFAEGFSVLTGDSYLGPLFRDWLPKTLADIQGRIDVVVN